MPALAGVAQGILGASETRLKYAQIMQQIEQEAQRRAEERAAQMQQMQMQDKLATGRMKTEHGFRMEELAVKDPEQARKEFEQFMTSRQFSPEDEGKIRSAVGTDYANWSQHYSKMLQTPATEVSTHFRYSAGQGPALGTAAPASTGPRVQSQADVALEQLTTPWEQGRFGTPPAAESAPLPPPEPAGIEQYQETTQAPAWRPMTKVDRLEKAQQLTQRAGLLRELKSEVARTDPEYRKSLQDGINAIEDALEMPKTVAPEGSTPTEAGRIATGEAAVKYQGARVTSMQTRDKIARDVANWRQDYQQAQLNLGRERNEISRLRAQSRTGEMSVNQWMTRRQAALAQIGALQGKVYSYSINKNTGLPWGSAAPGDPYDTLPDENREAIQKNQALIEQAQTTVDMANAAIQSGGTPTPTPTPPPSAPPLFKAPKAKWVEEALTDPRTAHLSPTELGKLMDRKFGPSPEHANTAYTVFKGLKAAGRIR